MAKISPCNDTNCPIQYILDLIGSKWAIPILQELFNGSRRTHQFLDCLPGISSKTLMIRLRELEAYGLVERKIYAEIPPHVEYSLTPKGREIQPVLVALYTLGQQWMRQEKCICPVPQASAS
jgi:DNA-binding HxlR family transcriptional regulator